MKLLSTNSALAQAEIAFIEKQLAQQGQTVSFETVATDRHDNFQLLINGKADAAIVRADEWILLGSKRPAELTLSVVLPRQDRREVVICRPGESFAALKPGDKIGTALVRRTAMLAAAFGYLEICPAPQPVDQRLELLAAGEFDAMIVARFPAELLNLQEQIDLVFEPDILCPAPGQGALGIVTRVDDSETPKAFSELHDADIAKCVAAEQQLVDTLGVDKKMPLGGYCEITQSGENARFIAVAADSAGKTLLWSRQKCPIGELDQLGKVVAADLRQQGADQLFTPMAAAS